MLLLKVQIKSWRKSSSQQRHIFLRTRAAKKHNFLTAILSLFAAGTPIGDKQPPLQLSAALLDVVHIDPWHTPQHRIAV
jgi:hypothetical protein